MSNLADKLPEKTRARLLSKVPQSGNEIDDLPPHLAKELRAKLTPDSEEQEAFDIKLPLYYASMVAMIIFVYFSIY